MTVYQDEIAALVMDKIVAQSTAVGSDMPREEYYVDDSIDNYSRGVWKKVKNFFTGTKNNTISLINYTVNVATTVASTRITDSWKAITYGDGGCFTIYQAAAMLKHPFSAVTLPFAEKKCYDLTKEYMGGSGYETSNKIDAFRHAVLCNVLAKEAWGTKSQKYAFARDIATAHEKGYNYKKNPISAEMDLHNNTVGLRFYNATTNAKYKHLLGMKIEVQPDELSYPQICTYMRDRANEAKEIPKEDFFIVLSTVSIDKLVYIDKSQTN